MPISIRGTVLLAGACMMAGLAFWGQQAPAQRTASSLDVTITYDPTLANIVDNGNTFWMQGGSMQLHAQFWHGLGLVADVAGLHTATVGSDGVGLDLVTATFGPRYTWSPKHHRMSLFGQALAGQVNGLNSIFPSATGASSSDSSLALQIGGGLNLSLTHHVSLRAFEANWLRTELPNATTNVQNKRPLRCGTGLPFQVVMNCGQMNQELDDSRGVTTNLAPLPTQHSQETSLLRCNFPL